MKRAHTQEKEEIQNKIKEYNRKLMSDAEALVAKLTIDECSQLLAAVERQLSQKHQSAHDILFPCEEKQTDEQTALRTALERKKFPLGALPYDLAHKEIASRIGLKNLKKVVQVSQDAQEIFTPSLKFEQASLLLKAVEEADFGKVEHIIDKHPKLMFVNGKDKEDNLISPLKLTFKNYDYYMWKLFKDKIKHDPTYVKSFVRQYEEQIERDEEQEKRNILTQLLDAYENLTKAFNSYQIYLKDKDSKSPEESDKADQSIRESLSKLRKAQKNLPPHIMDEFQRRTDVPAYYLDSHARYWKIQSKFNNESPPERIPGPLPKGSIFVRHLENRPQQVSIKSYLKPKSAEKFNKLLDSLQFDAETFKRLKTTRKTQLEDDIKELMNSEEYKMQIEEGQKVQGKPEKSSQPFESQETIKLLQLEELKIINTFYHELFQSLDKIIKHSPLYHVDHNLELYRELGKIVHANFKKYIAELQNAGINTEPVSSLFALAVSKYYSLSSYGPHAYVEAIHKIMGSVGDHHYKITHPKTNQEHMTDEEKLMHAAEELVAGLTIDECSQLLAQATRQLSKEHQSAHDILFPPQKKHTDEQTALRNALERKKFPLQELPYNIAHEKIASRIDLKSLNKVVQVSKVAQTLFTPSIIASLLVKAVEEADFGKIEKIINKHPELMFVNGQDKEGNLITPLKLAVIKGDVRAREIFFRAIGDNQDYLKLYQEQEVQAKELQNELSIPKSPK